ncbi:hypothetical protein [Marinomonas sp. S3726]|uniref:hypothetical protein n=1 Tax=Marinomonas sp. S3726 TaxID=579484 RepID=UPI000B2C93EB|nr:hypothetical protein [Marinomonas sp. S3726]
MQIKNWKDIAYLESGTKSRRQACMLLKEYKTLESLFVFKPILVSTVCVDLDVAGSLAF